MLKKFKVRNFKNFQDEVVFDLSKIKKYEFNNHLIKNGIVKSGVVFGKNGAGKTNLGYAIFDIVNHLTDKEKTTPVVQPYRNLNSKDEFVNFYYEFVFENSVLEYQYKKIDPEIILYEKLCIDGNELIEYDYSSNRGYCKLKGTENLNVVLDNTKLSFVKYINSNSVLERNNTNLVFKKFMSFVDNMLLFYSLDANKYFGYKSGSESLSDSIVRKNKLDDFNAFLNKLEIKCKLKSREVDGKYEIINVFDEGEANFFSTASTGTRALILFYYWLINSEEATLIFMDEFDAYYHFELSEEIVKEILKERDIQILFTSHNTNLMDNDIFRPDCLFILQDKGILSMSDLTQKELRKAHNLQKMYKAGAFNAS